MQSESGVIFGRYRLIEQLGCGGMARVFRSVVDGPRGFAHELVIKRIRPEYSRNAHFVNMLASEARLCGLLRHPSIVQVHEFGEVGGDFYLAMELVEGHDLLAMTKALARAERRMPVGVACHIVHELAGALGYAHALTDLHGRNLEVVHRDVSPSNVMLGTLGTVKLLDFGIAKAAAHVRDEQTTTGTLKGKIGYMSPEQAEGLPLDGRSDLFSLGVVFYELLTGRRLFRGEGDFERLRLVREAKVDPPSQLLPGLDPALDALVLKMLARLPAERFQRGDEIAAALTPFCSHAAALRQLISELQPFFALRPTTSAVEEGLDPMLSTSAGRIFADQPTTQSQRGGAPTGTGAGSRGELQPVPQLTGPSPAWAMWRWVLPAAGGAALVLLGMWASGSLRRTPAVVTPVVTPVATVAPAAMVATPPAAVGTGGVAAPTAAVVTVAAAAQEATKTPPTDLPAAPMPEVVRAPHRPAQVHLRVAGPDHSDVFVDGKLLGKTPLDVVLEPIAAERHVLVRQPGHAPWTRKVAGNVSVSVTAHLPHRKGEGGGEADRVYDPFAH